MNDAADSLRIGLSYPIGKARASANYVRSAYKDIFDPTLDETIISTNYGLSIPWGKRTTLSASYLISSTRNPTNTYGNSESTDSASIETRSRQQVTLRSRHTIIPGKLVASLSHTTGRNKGEQGRLQNDKGTTSMGLSYYLTKRNVAQLGYAITRNVDFISNSISSSDSRNAHITYSHIFAKSHNLEIRYGLAGAGDLDNSSKLYQNVRITYGYDF